MLSEIALCSFSNHVVQNAKLEGKRKAREQFTSKAICSSNSILKGELLITYAAQFPSITKLPCVHPSKSIICSIPIPSTAV